MIIEIAPTTQNTYTVNGKEVYQDILGNWIARDIHAFSPQELRAWIKYEKSAINGNQKNLKMTFLL